MEYFEILRYFGVIYLIQFFTKIISTEGQEDPNPRGIISESARIARGEVKNIKDLTSNSAEAVIFPGGFGAAKNLSSFGFKGAEMEVNEEVERVLKDFKQAGKPIAMCCIAPIIAAKVFGSSGVTVTLGNFHTDLAHFQAIFVCLMDKFLTYFSAS